MTEFSGKFDHTELGQSTVVISPSPEKLAEAHKLKSKGEISDKPTMLASVPSVLDPEMKAQNGLHTLHRSTFHFVLLEGWLDRFRRTKEVA